MSGFLVDVAQASLLAGCAYVLARIYAFQVEYLADSRCACAKGKVCAKCLAESEAIRPQPAESS